jgi:protein gp37
MANDSYIFNPWLTSEANWQKPLDWNPARVHLSGDVMDSRVSKRLRERLFDLIRRTPHLRWEIVTKMPQNFQASLPWVLEGAEPYANVWLGVSIGTRQEALRRIWILQTIPARMKVLHAEVMEDLGVLNLSGIFMVFCEKGCRNDPMQLQWIKHLQEQCHWQYVGFVMKPFAKGPLPDEQFYQLTKARIGVEDRQNRFAKK